MHDFITNMNRTYNAAETFFFLLYDGNEQYVYEFLVWKLYIYLKVFPTVCLRNFFFESFKWTESIDGNFRSIRLVLSNVPFLLIGHSFCFLPNVLILIVLLLSIKLYRFSVWLLWFPLIIFWIFKFRRSNLVLFASFVTFRRILASWFTVCFPFAVNCWWPFGSESELEQLKSNSNM